MDCELRPLDKVDYAEDKEPEVAEEVKPFERFSDEELVSINSCLVESLSAGSMYELVTHATDESFEPAPEYAAYAIDLTNQVHQQLCARVLAHPNRELACKWIGQVVRRGQRNTYLVVDVSEQGKPLGLSIYEKKNVCDKTLAELPVKSSKLVILHDFEHYQNLQFKNPRKRSDRPRENKRTLEYDGGELAEDDYEIAGVDKKKSKRSDPFDVQAFLQTDRFRKHALDYVSEMSAVDLVTSMARRGVDLFAKLKKHCHMNSKADAGDPSLIVETSRRDDAFVPLPGNVQLVKGGNYSLESIYYSDVKQDDWKKPEPEEVPDEDQALLDAIPAYERTIANMQREFEVKKGWYEEAQKNLETLHPERNAHEYKRQNNVCNRRRNELQKLLLDLRTRTETLENVHKKLRGEAVKDGARAGRRFDCKHAQRVDCSTDQDILYLYETEEQRAMALRLCLSDACPRALFTQFRQRGTFYLYKVDVVPFGECYVLGIEKPPDEKPGETFIQKKEFVESLVGNVGVSSKCTLAHQRKFLLENYKLPIVEFARNFSEEMKRHLTIGGAKLADKLKGVLDVAGKLILPEWLYPDDCGDMKHSLCNMKCFSNGTVVSGLDRRNVSRKELVGVELPSTYKQVVESVAVERWFKDKDMLSMGPGYRRTYASCQPNR